MIKGFRTHIIFRVLLLALTIGGLCVLILKTELIASMLLVGGMVLLQMVLLIRFLETTNKKLGRFIEAINYDDFSQTFFNHKKEDTFSELGEIFNQVIGKFKHERAKGEESARYLETVVQHIGVGLISFNQNGEIELINTTAKRLLGSSVLRSVSQLEAIDEQLYRVVMEMKSGNRILLHLNINEHPLQLAMYATEFRMKGNNYTLISLQNISSELDEKEMEAWQNLTQVLAHEIMNSITPIASLADTVNSLLGDGELSASAVEPISAETLTDVKEALTTINKRSIGLMRFVNSYRNLMQLPNPVIEVLSLYDTLVRVSNLMKGESTRNLVDISIMVEPESLEISADAQLIDQALINIVKNAFKALQETPGATIQLRGRLSGDGHPVIEIEDNGPGIKETALDKIFVPFYTTRKEVGFEGGTGIGLSLSRQIMRMHGGSLTVNKSEPGKTIFQLKF